MDTLIKDMFHAMFFQIFDDVCVPMNFLRALQHLGNLIGTSSNHPPGLDQAMLGAGPRIWHYAQNCWRPCGSRSGDSGDEETIHVVIDSLLFLLVVGDHF